MKTKQELAGIYVASITAYDQAGNVDAAALQKLMQRNINEGAAGFFVGGSSGECFMLTEAERVQVFEAAAAYAGKTNLIAHVGAIGTAEAVRYAKAAMGMGYDVVAATAPFYYGGGQDGILHIAFGHGLPKRSAATTTTLLKLPEARC